MAELFTAAAISGLKLIAMCEPAIRALNTTTQSTVSVDSLKQRQSEFEENHKFREQQRAIDEQHRQEDIQRHAQYRAEDRAWSIDMPHWPLKLSADVLTHPKVNHGKVPLTVILSPPTSSDPKLAAMFNEVVSNQLESQLEHLLQNHYAMHNPQRPVQIITKAWRENRAGGSAMAQALYVAIPNHPTLLIDLNLNHRDIQLSISYWGFAAGPHNQLNYLTLHDHPLPLSHFLGDVVRRQTQAWAKDSYALKKDAPLGSAEELRIFAHNCKTLEAEQKLGKPQTAHYQYTLAQLQEAGQHIVPGLQMLVAAIADLYHLQRYHSLPYFPALLAEFFSASNDPLINDLFNSVIDDYGKVYQFLCQDQPELGANLFLELSEGLAKLPNSLRDHQFAKTALQHWQAWRQIDTLLADNATLTAKLAADDADYLYRLAQCFKTHEPSLALKLTELASLATNRPKLNELANPVNDRCELPAIQHIHGWSTEQVQTLQRHTASALNRPITYSDTLKSGGSGPEMVIIPAGSFIMGSLYRKLERYDRERPQHLVTLAKPFGMGRHAVTFNDYDRFCQHTKTNKPGDYGWGRNNRPVINVSWDDVVAYCTWLNQQTSGGYRLPSESEWEYACRAGTTTEFWWGDSITTAQANYCGNHSYHGGSKGKYREKTMPVGEFPPNPWGLYQMHGNVREWCMDDWHDNYEGAPSDGSIWSNTGNVSRVVRGGNWIDNPSDLRSACRSFKTAGYRYTGTRFWDPHGDRYVSIGFRLVQDICL